MTVQQHHYDKRDELIAEQIGVDKELVSKNIKNGVRDHLLKYAAKSAEITCDILIEMFDKFNLPKSHELKANWIIVKKLCHDLTI